MGSWDFESWQDPPSSGQAPRLEILGSSDIADLHLMPPLEADSFFLGGHQSFFLRPSTAWVRPAHILEALLLYSESTDLNANHI